MKEHKRVLKRPLLLCMGVFLVITAASGRPARRGKHDGILN